jgi:hypothetical protein
VNPSSWHSYPKLFALGHRALDALLLDDVVVEEKLDGSQFSFGVFKEWLPTAGGGVVQQNVLKIRSKGVVMNVEAPEKMFNKAVETVKDLADRWLLNEGWTYRAEYLAKPKHNALAYDRAPNGFLAIFDINLAEESYLPYEAKAAEALRLGLDVVPLIYQGRIASIEQFRPMLDRVSFLGGQKIEGVVVKNYNRFGPDKKVLMGKFVSEAFKEIHGGEWKKANPTHSDIVEQITASLATPARWVKAVQHLRERGALEDSPKDIGPLLKEIGTDVHAECADEVRDALFKWAWPRIQRGIIRGFPEWYKGELLKRQFDQEMDHAAQAATLGEQP